MPIINNIPQGNVTSPLGAHLVYATEFDSVNNAPVTIDINDYNVVFTEEEDTLYAADIVYEPEALGNSSLISTDVQGAISEINRNKQNKINGTIGQIVGFDQNGNLIAQAPPETATIASPTKAGIVRVSSVSPSQIVVNTETDIQGKYYPIKLNQDEKIIVNVPWENNKTDCVMNTSDTVQYVTTCAGNGNQALTYHSGIYIDHLNGVLYGAAWNDYAEYRKQKEQIPPGYCVASSNEGKIYKTSFHLQACDGIVSDTFGFAIGETEECKTPLAVAGRVLAYCEGDRYDYHSGDTVGASKNGKVVKMTRNEIKEYPDRIVGIVSEIPEYKTWGAENVEVNGRIWIKIK